MKQSLGLGKTPKTLKGKKRGHTHEWMDERTQTSLLELLNYFKQKKGRPDALIQQRSKQLTNISMNSGR